MMVRDTLSEFDVEIASRTAWMEARGEPLNGQRAIIHVIANRHNSGRWYSGRTLAGTCLKPLQFSCWNEGDPNRQTCAELTSNDPRLAALRGMVAPVLDGGDPDPTSGATHYYSVTMPLPPEWVKTGRFTVQIGKHRFYADVP